MARRTIGRRDTSVKSGVYDIQEVYDHSFDNRWSDYTDIEIQGSYEFFDTPNGYRTVIFGATSVINVLSSGDQYGVEYVVVGGGGGGGTGVGGGGGAGQVKQGRINLDSTSYTITFGAGGAQSLAAGGPTGDTSVLSPRTSFPGSPSSIGSIVSSAGGGQGGSSIWAISGFSVNGGAGGGGTFSCCPATPASGGPGGTNGCGSGGSGSYTIPGNGSGGGGGGAAGNGSNSKDSILTLDGWVTKGGDGGIGLKTILFDPTTGEYGQWMPAPIRSAYFADNGFLGGGGGGGCSQPGGAYAPSYTGGGIARHGGGNGAVGFANGVAGRVFSGGGGGGGGQTDSPYRYGSGGAGGSGVVMMRYRFRPTQPGSIVALATGGTINLNAGDGYVYHTFLGTGVFKVLIDNLDCEVLVVGGGGAAQRDRSGGGGAGGVVYDSSLKLKKGTYLAEIGAGGATNIQWTPKSTTTGQGIPTTFADIVALGGAQGGFVWSGSFPPGSSGTLVFPATSGGSGSGGINATGFRGEGLQRPGFWTNTPVTRTHYGNPGGGASPLNTSQNILNVSTTYAGGGGGGAGANGATAAAITTVGGAAGGAGQGFPQFPYSVCGIPVSSVDANGTNYYGGGGCGYTPPLATSWTSRIAGGGGGKIYENGGVNLGGGGGHSGGTGGSGVVIVRYRVNDPQFPTNKL